MTEWNIGTWCCRYCVPVRQHYKVATSVHCHKSVHVADITLDVGRAKTPTNKTNLRATGTGMHINIVYW